MEIQKKCYIIGSGEFEATYFHPGREDYLIAADGGYHRFVSLGLIPNLLIGDFDSIGKFELSDEEAREKGIRIERLPKEKNDTDLLAAIRVGLDEGCRDFHIFGGTGGRIDHTIANIQCLTYLSIQGCKGHLYGSNYELFTITNNRVTFEPLEQGMIAVFAMGDRAEGVYLTGLKYPLINATITKDYPIGVSNEFLGIESYIEVQNGTLLVVHYLTIL